MSDLSPGVRDFDPSPGDEDVNAPDIRDREFEPETYGTLADELDVSLARAALMFRATGSQT